MSALKTLLLNEIKAHGPMRLSAFMRRALADTEHGYYMQRRPFGARDADGGDFITAPEVSQMFGELIGAWLADLWDRMGRPSPFCLAELGPGRGTLMADILRTTQIMPQFAAAAQVHFVETSPALRATQKQALPQNQHLIWHDDITTLPPLPCLLLANEFFDALPIDQYKNTATSDQGWSPLMVDGMDDALIYADGALEAAPFSDALCACIPSQIETGAIVESCPEGEDAMRQVTAHIATHGGAALIIDYGHADKTCGDSFQAMRGHEYVDPLAAPGMADLTAHVNFPLLAHIANAAGLQVAPTTQQGDFLEALGLSIRAQALMQSSPAREKQINAERVRLAAPHEMGALFKVLGIAHPDMPPLAGFHYG